MRRRTLCLLPAVAMGGVAIAALRRSRSITSEAPRAASEPRVLSRPAMGTVWQIVLPKSAPAHAERSASRALDEVCRLEDVLSEFRSHTEVSRINAAAGRGSVVVSEDTWTVTERALDYARRSDGAFDPTWASLRSVWSFRDAMVPSPERVRASAALVDWTAVEMDRARRSIGLRRAGMALGFGGIAKGYALDRMRAMLLADSVRDFVLYSGGQVLAEGTREGRLWRVGVQHPRDRDGLIATLAVSGVSVSTGGDYEHYFEHEGRRYHHVLDPRTGWPVQHTSSVTVVSESALDADALDTALFVQSPSRAEALARSIDAAVLRADPSMRLTSTPPMRALLSRSGIVA